MNSKPERGMSHCTGQLSGIRTGNTHHRVTYFTEPKFFFIILMIKGVVFLVSSLNGLAGKEIQTSVTLKRNKVGWKISITWNTWPSPGVFCLFIYYKWNKISHLFIRNLAIILLPGSQSIISLEWKAFSAYRYWRDKCLNLPRTMNNEDASYKTFLL